jgi:predicted ATPase/DNA-binding CsgD family transcriptional regulator
LPKPSTSLVGREREVAGIRQLLDAVDVRLVTLTGPGGIGKTRLALEVARSFQDEYAHGVHFVPLAPVQDADLIPVAIADVLTIRITGEAPVSDIVIATLRDRHTLMVLDNLEHVVGFAAPWIADLLSRCPRAHILATSRVALRIGGEHLVPVPPLTLPDPNAEMAVELVEQSEAVQLFTQRARAIRPAYSLTDANAGTVSEICQRLDGIPLALELAAARINLLAPAALLDRLTHQLGVLNSGGRDLPIRHQTMSNAVAWSHDLLSPAEQGLFRHLSVFVNGFTLDAAETLAIDDDGNIAHVPASELVASLLNHSLIRRAKGEERESRFTMLEPIREFGLNQLAMHRDDHHAREAHASYFIQLARQSEAAMQGYGHVTRLAILEAEHDNIWAALDWLTLHERIEDAMELAGSLWYVRKTGRYVFESRGQLELLLAHPQGAARTIQRARALVLVAAYASEQGDHARAADAHKEALAVFREIGDGIGAVQVLRSMALALTIGNLDQAIETLRESLALAREREHQWGIAAALDQLAGLHMYRNETDTALECLRESLRMHKAMDDHYGVANALAYKGMLIARKGDMLQAAEHYQACISLSTDIDDKVRLAMGLIGLADITRADGDLPAANSSLERGLSIARGTGWLHGTAFALGALGCLAVATMDFDRAVYHLRESVVAFERLGIRYGLQHGATICFDGFACLAIARGDARQAARFLGMADGLYERIGVSRPDGDPPYVEARWIDTVRRGLDKESLRTAWSDGHALSDDELIAEALAFALPPTSKARPMAHVAHEAARGLSPRELQVLRLMADGLTNQEIADVLFVSLRTVTGHTAHILGKLGLNSRTGVVAYAIRNGLA